MRLLGIGGLALLLLACGDDDKKTSGEVAGDDAGSTDAPLESTSADGVDVDVSANVNASADVSTELNLITCAQGLSDAEIASAAQIAFDLDQSMHELVACGGMTVSISAALITGVIGMVFDPDGDLIPSGLTYEGEGLYHTDGGLGSSVSMDVRLYELVDGEFVLVEADLFDPKSYLVGVEVNADADADIDFDITNPLDTKVSADATLEATYESAGPWAKILGLGDPPANPIHISDLAALDPDFGDIYIESDVRVSDVHGETEITFEVQTGKQALTEVFSSGGVSFDVVSLSGENVSLGQTLQADEFAIEFVGGNQLDGHVSFSVQADAMAYVGVLQYDGAAFADVALDCN